MGDIDQSGVINILDVVMGVNIILETISYTNYQLYLMDMNQDHETDILDIIEIVNYILAE